MFNIISLLSQYQILQHTAEHLSILDLLHLATTCSELHALIRKSDAIFDRLKRTALCDGHGLKLRQEFKALYAVADVEWRWGQGRRPHYDEEVEVRIWVLIIFMLKSYFSVGSRELKGRHESRAFF